MKMVRRLPSVEELQEEMPITEQQFKNRKQKIKEIKDILKGVSNKKLIIIGPCSADNEKAVLDYMIRINKVQQKIKDNILIVPRVYTSKPRTNSLGYKGMFHRPNSEESEDNIYQGIFATRRLHLKIINETDFFCADEMLYPEAFSYLVDLLAYTTIGARSVENQQHRMVSSGLDMPVGMKNPTSGEISIMLNAITAAQNKQTFFYRGWECITEGNPYAHGILRGYINSEGKAIPNYYYEVLRDIYDIYIEWKLRNASILVDCNHCNSRKYYKEQIRIAKEVFENCKKYKKINNIVKGLMIESYIEDGKQNNYRKTYGKSITDACLGWEKTEKLLYELAFII